MQIEEKPAALGLVLPTPYEHAASEFALHSGVALPLLERL